MMSRARYIQRAAAAGLFTGVVLIALGCQPPPPDIASRRADAGQDGPQVAVASQTPRRLRRLSNREYDNVVRDLLGDTTAPARAFLADAFVSGYDNGPGDLVVQSDQVE
jgi:hypothetical protein